MEPVHDVHSQVDGLRQNPPIPARQPAARRSRAEDKVVGLGAGVRQCIGKVTADGNAVRRFTEHCVGVTAGLLAADDL